MKSICRLCDKDFVCDSRLIGVDVKLTDDLRIVASAIRYPEIFCDSCKKQYLAKRVV